VGVLVLTAIVAGCGSDEANDPAGQPGKQLFVEKCGSCHVLAAAETKGVTGPNLDAAFDQSLDAGIKRSTIESVVLGQIRQPMGNIMKPDLVDGKDAEAVAGYVADSVGTVGSAPKQEQATSESAKANAQNVLQNPADPTGQLAFKYKDLEAQAGKVTIETTNDSSVPHNIAIEGDGKGPIVSGGKTSKVVASLEPGKYTFLCTVPGHAQAGMKGTLTVK
jgi:plastocyanin